MNRLAFSIALVLIVWAPMPFGSQRPWACFILAAGASVALILASWSSTYYDWLRLKRAKWCAIALLSLPVLCVVQLVPLPFDLRGDSAIWFGGYALSYSPFDTLLYLFKTTACVWAFFTLILTVDSRLRVVIVLLAVALSGFIQAVYGMSMTLSGLEYSFLIKKYAGFGQATGTFINANHYAAYLLLCLMCVLSLLWAKAVEPTKASERLSFDVSFILRWLLGFIVGAIFLSNSRAASVLLIVLIGCGFVLHCYLFRRFSFRALTYVMVFLGVNVVVIGGWLSFGDSFQQLAQGGWQTDSRFVVYQDAMPLLWQHILVGVGAGAFDTVFTAYNTVQPPLRFMYLHNDYLQLLIEFGVFGACSAVSFIVMILIWAFRALKVRRSWQIRASAASTIMVVIWLMVHSTVDFSLHISAIAFSVASLLGVFCAAVQLPKRQSRLDK